MDLLAPSTPLGPRLAVQWHEGVQRLHITPRRNLKLIAIAFGGLLFGVAKEFHGIDDFLHQRTWLSDFVVAVLVLGVVLWLAAFVSEFFGTEIISTERGELVISRGIGPVRREFRYRVSDICELVSRDPSAEGDGKQGVHHILWRAKNGAVKFEYGEKEIYLAETLDEEGGERVVDWLRQRLPRSASEMMLRGGRFR